MLPTHGKKPVKLRYESFGGILATEEPPALVFADADLVRSLGYPASPLWDRPDTGVLSAPVEAHAALTRHCPAGCPGCYMDAAPDPGALGEDGLPRALEMLSGLAEMGVFHVALGGGESFLLPWLFEAARRCRSLGMVPNVTTSGLAMTPEQAYECRVFGQVNVSLDAVDERFSRTRGGSFEKADRAVRLLKENKIRVGINCVVSRENYAALPEILAYAKSRGLCDVELLRFKPSGRGRDLYEKMRLTREQAIGLLPRLKKLAWRHRLPIKLDCSFTPFVAFHGPQPKVMDYFAVLGCEAANWLIGVSPEGRVSPCSFLEGPGQDLASLKDSWAENAAFAPFRRFADTAKAPCSKCRYLSLCKGGCRAVALFVTGDPLAPDPECPLANQGFRA